MPKKRVLIALPLADDLYREISEVCDVVLPSGGMQVPSAEELRELLPKVDGVLTTIRSRYDAALLSQCPTLQVISNFAVGYDNVDVEAATAAGILVCNTPGVLDRAVAYLTVGLIFALARDIPRNNEFVRSGSWTKGAAPLTQDIRGKTLGLVGMGRIGATVAEMARQLGMRVIYFKPRRDTALEAKLNVGYRSRDEVFAQSDFVSVHMPLDDTTRGCITGRDFALMKRSAYFINTSRGGVVVEPDLVEALQQQKIAGAGLDVMVTEPLPQDHPLCSLQNVILQPHVGSATVETRRAMIELAVRNLLAVMQGKRPLAAVNPSVLESGAASLAS